VPRPRFEKLDAARRAAILSSAADEFAEHGFEGASYNRIIEHSGLSKGAMYYYFDDKEDLFVTTLSDALRRLILEVGNVAAATTAEEFWKEVQVWCRRSLQLFQEDPAALGLARSFFKTVERGTASTALSELRRIGRTSLDGFIRHGQRLGAVRDDLPHDLLVSVLMAVEEAIDLWLADRIDELGPKELDELAATSTLLHRRVAEPERARRREPETKQRKPGQPRKGRS
jgi:AcrR family transcriptional regulator